MPYPEKAVKGCVCLLLCVVFPAIITCREASGYVLPPEQLIGFMAAGVVGFETLGMTMERIGGEEENGDKSTTVDVWYSSPEDVGVRCSDGAGGQGCTVSIMDFLELFCGKRHRIERFLARHGVDAGSSAYTRVERTPAYSIGGGSAASPVFILEKSRFVPLILRYEPRHVGADDLVEVRFLDYRPVGHGWFPHEIRFLAADGVTDSYKVVDIRLNEPVPPWLSSIDP